jgi:hypothetical protein
MREDMFKVLLERPRYGAGRGRKGRRAPLDELSPSWEPIGRNGTKGLNENLAPLHRWLRRQVGRPWDKVYSELSAVVSVRSAVQQHVRDHVPDLVRLHVQERDGRLYAWRRCGPPEPVGLRRTELYVCPRTGLLREVLYRRPAPRETHAHVRWVDRDKCYLRLEGSWFEVRCEPFPGRIGTVYDVVLHRQLSAACLDRSRDKTLCALYGRVTWAAAKRQLSRVELKRAGLVGVAGAALLTVDGG